VEKEARREERHKRREERRIRRDAEKEVEKDVSGSEDINSESECDSVSDRSDSSGAEETTTEGGKRSAEGLRKSTSGSLSNTGGKASVSDSNKSANRVVQKTQQKQQINKIMERISNRLSKKSKLDTGRAAVDVKSASVEPSAAPPASKGTVGPVTAPPAAAKKLLIAVTSPKVGGRDQRAAAGPAKVAQPKVSVNAVGASAPAVVSAQPSKSVSTRVIPTPAIGKTTPAMADEVESTPVQDIEVPAPTVVPAVPRRVLPARLMQIAQQYSSKTPSVNVGNTAVAGEQQATGVVDYAGAERSPGSSDPLSVDAGPERSPRSSAPLSVDAGPERSPGSSDPLSVDAGPERSPRSSDPLSVDAGAERSPGSSDPLSVECAQITKGGEATDGSLAAEDTASAPLPKSDPQGIVEGAPVPVISRPVTSKDSLPSTSKVDTPTDVADASVTDADAADEQEAQQKLQEQTGDADVADIEAELRGLGLAEADVQEQVQLYCSQEEFRPRRCEPVQTVRASTLPSKPSCVVMTISPGPQSRMASQDEEQAVSLAVSENGIAAGDDNIELEESIEESPLEATGLASGAELEESLEDAEVMGVDGGGGGEERATSNHTVSDAAPDYGATTDGSDEEDDEDEGVMPFYDAAAAAALVPESVAALTTLGDDEGGAILDQEDEDILVLSSGAAGLVDGALRSTRENLQQSRPPSASATTTSSKPPLRPITAKAKEEDGGASGVAAADATTIGGESTVIVEMSPRAASSGSTADRPPSTSSRVGTVAVSSAAPSPRLRTVTGLSGIHMAAMEAAVEKLQPWTPIPAMTRYSAAKPLKKPVAKRPRATSPAVGREDGGKKVNQSKSSGGLVAKSTRPNRSCANSSSDSVTTAPSSATGRRRSGSGSGDSSDSKQGKKPDPRNRTGLALESSMSMPRMPITKHPISASTSSESCSGTFKLTGTDSTVEDSSRSSTPMSTDGDAMEPEHSVLLKDVYTNIAMIFPMTYSIGNSNTGGASPVASGNVSMDMYRAKGLLGSMYSQIQVYDEWLEVMSDYATVFSETSGIAERAGGGGLSERAGSRGDPDDPDADPSADDDSFDKDNCVFTQYRNATRQSSSSGFGDAGADEAGAGAGAGATEGAGNNAVYDGNASSLHYRVKSSRPEVYNIVTDVFNNSKVLQAKDGHGGRGGRWMELPQGLGLGLSWNLLWTWQKPRINMSHLLIWQRVNHFENSKQLTRKDLLKKTLERYTGNTICGEGDGTMYLKRSKLAEFFEIMPQTYVLPTEYTAFVKAFTELENRKAARAQAIADAKEGNGLSEKDQRQLLNYWIMKPIGLSRGRGISLIKDLSFSYSLSSVIQQYVENPMTLDGYKFDLRIYVLVTSFKPLEAFIYKEGFARLSTQKYSTAAKDTDNNFIHLTNSSIQKHNAEGITKDNPLVSHLQGAAAAAYDPATGVYTNSSGKATEPPGPGSASQPETNGSKIPLTGDYGLWVRLEQQQERQRARDRAAAKRNGSYDEAADEAASKTTVYDTIWKSICLLVIKTLVAVDDKMTFQPCCFEHFGFDVLLDDNFRPWLLEVNASPSLARETQLDIRVKNACIEDTIRLIDPPPFNRAAVSRILKRRLEDMSKNKFMNKNDAELESDLRDILGDEYVPRRFGEDPRYMGDYQRLCPNTKLFEGVMRLKGKLIKGANT